MTWSIERVVTICTPLFSAASAVGLGWLGKHFPGLPTPSPTDVVALEITGATAAGAAALKWLHGRAHYTELVDDAEKARAELAKVRAQIAANPNAGPALADIQALLKAHEGQVESVIDEHVPLAVGQALKLLFASLGGGPAPTAEQAAAATITGALPVA